jgi:hypothetical protein
MQAPITKRGPTRCDNLLYHVVGGVFDLLETLPGRTWSQGYKPKPRYDVKGRGIQDALNGISRESVVFWHSFAGEVRQLKGVPRVQF